MDRCVQDNRAWSAIDILTFFPASLACFSVIFHLFPIVSVETKRCLQQAVFYGMQFEWRRKERVGGEIGKVLPKAKMPGAEGGKEGGCQEGCTFQRAERESAEWVLYIYITEYSDALKTTTEEASSLQPCVCFINQAARSHYFLT